MEPDIQLIVKCQCKAGAHIHWVTGAVALYQSEIMRANRLVDNPRMADLYDAAIKAIPELERRLRIFSITGMPPE